jgi:CheY-like chemotaxis protein/HPt (histidine-containing phosphotransfer) domain-containing protein
MPGMTGAEMARIVRNTDGLAHTPIIMLTSVDQSLANTSYRDLGIDAQLIKPARSSVLLETLVATIQRHRHAAAVSSPPQMASGSLGLAQPSPAKPSVSERALLQPPPVRARVRSTGTERGLDILVAEDNEVNQMVFTQILGETGYGFEIVGNGRRALDAYGRLNPRMILMDVSMPEMNGLEATAAIRRLEEESGTHVPIVGVTAHALKGDRERCLEAGMDGYVAKPIRTAELLQAISQAAPAGPPPPVLIDEHALLERLNGDRALLRELIEVFQGDCPLMLEAVGQAVQAGDAAAVQAATHKLKGSVANFSASSAHEAALRLENMARQQDLSGATAAFTVLKKEISRMRRALDNLGRRGA